MDYIKVNFTQMFMKSLKDTFTVSLLSDILACLLMQTENIVGHLQQQFSTQVCNSNYLDLYDVIV